MSDDVAVVVSSLNDLQKVLEIAQRNTGGLTKSLLEAANSTNAASKRWTIFSRLVSGTPLWKLQNYLRGVLGVLGEFDESAKNNIKTQQEQSKQILEMITHYDGLTDKFEDINLAVKETSEYYELLYNAQQNIDRQTRKIANLTARGFSSTSAKEKLSLLQEEKKRMEELRAEKFKDLEQNATYQKMLLLHGKSEASQHRARIAAVSEYEKLYDQQTKMVNRQKNALKDVAAFDEERLELAKKRAIIDAENNPLLDREETIKAYQKDEKIMMKRQQKQRLKQRGTEVGKALTSKKFFTEGFKPLLIAMTPLTGLAKLTKAALPFTSDSRKFQLKMTKIAFRTVKVMDFFFKYMMLGLVVAGVILVGMKYFKELYGILKEMGVIERIKDLGKDLMGILTDVFSVIAAFISGDYEKIVPLLARIFDKGILFLLKTIGVILDVGFLALVAAFKLVGDFIVKFLEDPSFREKIWKGLLAIGLIIGTWYLARYIIAQALILAGIAALPVLLGVVIIAGLYTLGKYYKGALVRFFQPLINGVTWLLGVIQDIRTSISNFGRKIRKLPGFADGGVSAGGLAVVGERGPELVNLPAGSQVHSNSDSKKMLGGTVNNFNITINARDTSDQELRRIADKIGQMVNTKINRTTSSTTFGG